MATYRCRRPLDIGESKRGIGELVPEAATWPLVDHQIHVGNIVPIIVENDEFIDAVKKYCPELSDELGVPKRSPKVVSTKE